MDARQRADLDNHITGHYGEDQFPPEIPMTAVVYWNDGMVNEWTMGVTGDESTLPLALNELRDRGAAEGLFWMQWMRVESQLPLTIDPTEPIEAFLARDWGLDGDGTAAEVDARSGYASPDNPLTTECGAIYTTNILGGQDVCARPTGHDGRHDRRHDIGS